MLKESSTESLFSHSKNGGFWLAERRNESTNCSSFTICPQPFCLSAVYMGRSPGHLVISGTGVPAQYPQTPRPPARGVLCPASLTSAHPSQQAPARLTRSQTLSLMTMKMNHWQFGGDQSCNNVSCNELDEVRHQKAATWIKKNCARNTKRSVAAKKPPLLELIVVW